MGVSAFWLILKAVLVIVPFIIQMVQEQKIKTATEKEVYDAFEQEFAKRWADRIKASSTADSNSGGMPDEKSDPNNRANKSNPD